MIAQVSNSEFAQMLRERAIIDDTGAVLVSLDLWEIILNRLANSETKLETTENYKYDCLKGE